MPLFHLACLRYLIGLIKAEWAMLGSRGIGGAGSRLGGERKRNKEEKEGDAQGPVSQAVADRQISVRYSL